MNEQVCSDKGTSIKHIPITDSTPQNNQNIDSPTGDTGGSINSGNNVVSKSVTTMISLTPTIKS